MLRTIVVGLSVLAASLAADAADQLTPRQAALVSLQHVKALFEQVCAASPAPGATVLPAGVQVRLSRLMAFTGDLLSKGDDKELMTALIDATVVSECSADHDRAIALARIFRARPEPLNGNIAALAQPARCRVVTQLQWGLANDFLPTAPAAKGKSDIDARVAKLKQGCH